MSWSHSQQANVKRLMMKAVFLFRIFSSALNVVWEFAGPRRSQLSNSLNPEARVAFVASVKEEGGVGSKNRPNGGPI